MYHEDYFNPADLNDFNDDNNVKKIFEKAKYDDKGYNVVYRKAERKDGKLYNKKIELYTTSGIGNHIRDAETGEYYTNLVGSRDEDLFYTVILATGECRSANGSSTLFYNSPQHYATHLLCDIDPVNIEAWNMKRNARLSELKQTKKQTYDFVEVK